MADDFNIEFTGLEELQNKLEEVRNRFPGEGEKILQKTGRKLRKLAKDKTPLGPGRKHMKDKYKLSKINYEKDGININMTNTSPHFHLVEKGHRQVTKDGREIGFTPGKHMVETSMIELQQEFPQELGKWLDKILEGANR